MLRTILLLHCCLILSCQTQETIKEKPTSKTIEAQVTASDYDLLSSEPTITDNSKDLIKVKQKTPPKRNEKKNIPRAKAKNIPKKSVSPCPAGMNGQLVGKIEGGRYCLSRSESLGCWKKEDGDLKKKGLSHCKDYQKRLVQAKMWSPTSDSHLELSSIQIESCRCTTFNEEMVCKSMVKFQCEKVLKPRKTPNRNLRKWEDLKYKQK